MKTSLAALRPYLVAFYAFLKERIARLAKHRLVRKAAPLLPAIGALLLILPMTLLPLWRSAELMEFDLLTIASAPKAQHLPIVIAGIDETSMQMLNKQWPWPRSWHAKLIDALSAEGAAVIAFDVIFDQPSNDEKEDAALEAAIRRAGNVILASHEVQQDTVNGSFNIEQKPLKRFIDAGAKVGKITMPPDGDRIIRVQPSHEHAMWREVIKELVTRVPALQQPPEPRPELSARISKAFSKDATWHDWSGIFIDNTQDFRPDLSVASDRRIRYLGPLNTFPYISYYQAADPRNNLKPGILNGQVVLVGRTALAAASIGGQTDTFSTPYTIVDHQLMPGVEIHATLIETAIQHQRLSETSRTMVILAAILSSILLSLLCHKRRIIWLPVLWLGTGGVLAGGGLLSFAFAGWWMPIMPALSAITLTFLLRFLVVYITERRQRLAIRKMFTLYVPPKLVAQLEASPESLSLGGAQRDITVMFTDLAGFTTIAENMPVQEVGKLLNIYFEAMTRIVFDHDGTVDKFIGDAIMAFWGAPIDDPNQAAHAVACVKAIQEASVKLNASFVEAGLPMLTTRIGLHSGSAMVGNFGSPERFSYTALGDMVNLGARLEGANKAYGTTVLISDDTARMAGDAISLRRVDRVRVKGKTEPVVFYTPCDDAELIARSDSAWQPYVDGDWETALAIWQSINEKWPNDPVAHAFIERLSKGRPEDWDGSWTMESK